MHEPARAPEEGASPDNCRRSHQLAMNAQTATTLPPPSITRPLSPASLMEWPTAAVFEERAAGALAYQP
jgi:hypothetical protein